MRAFLSIMRLPTPGGSGLPPGSPTRWSDVYRSSIAGPGESITARFLRMTITLGGSAVTRPGFGSEVQTVALSRYLQLSPRFVHVPVISALR